ncbi:MAG: CU044_2847 family protein [Actinomycetota bacterium]|nr:CU044_2847 family protein [Actinomycetota bacterium]
MTRVTIDDTEEVLVPVVDLVTDDWDGLENTAGPGDVMGAIELDRLLRPVRLVGEKVRDQLADLRPSKVTFECGLAVGVRNGKLTALLVDGQADVSMTLALEWDLRDGENPSEQ